MDEKHGSIVWISTLSHAWWSHRASPCKISHQLTAPVLWLACPNKDPVILTWWHWWSPSSPPISLEKQEANKDFILMRNMSKLRNEAKFLHCLEEAARNIICPYIISLWNSLNICQRTQIYSRLASCFTAFENCLNPEIGPHKEFFLNMYHLQFIFNYWFPCRLRAFTSDEVPAFKGHLASFQQRFCSWHESPGRIWEDSCHVMVL